MTNIKVEADVAGVMQALEAVRSKTDQLNRMTVGGEAAIDTGKAVASVKELSEAMALLEERKRQAAKRGAVGLDTKEHSSALHGAVKATEGLMAAHGKLGRGENGKGLASSLKAMRALEAESRKAIKSQEILARLLGRKITAREAGFASANPEALSTHRNAERHKREIFQQLGLNAQNQDFKTFVSTIAGRGAAGIGRAALPVGGVGGAIMQSTVAEASATEGGMLSGAGMGRLAAGGAIGLAVMGAIKGITAIAGKVGEAQDIATQYADLKQSIGGVTTDFNQLRDAVQYSMRGLGMSYEESVKLARAFAHTANLQPGDAGTLGPSMQTAVGFGRGYGIDPEKSANFFAEMQHYGVTKGEGDNRRLALMIGESVARGGNASKADEVLAAVTQFTALASRQSLSVGNVEGIASLLATLTGGKTPGMDVSGAAASMGKANAALGQGGAFGPASQNFMLGAYQGGMPGFDALDMQYMNAGGAFQSVEDIFGEDSDTYKNAAPDKQRQMQQWVATNGKKTGLDFAMQQLQRQYPDGRARADAGKNHLGFSTPQEYAHFEKAYKSDPGLGSLQAKIGPQFDLGKLNVKSIAALAQLQNADGVGIQAQSKKLLALSGSDALSPQQKTQLTGAMAGKDIEAQRELVMQLTAEHDTIKDAGQEARDNAVAIKNAILDFSQAMVPMTNTIMGGISALVQTLAPDSEFSKAQMEKKGSEDRMLKVLALNDAINSPDAHTATGKKRIDDARAPLLETNHGFKNYSDDAHKKAVSEFDRMATSGQRADNPDLQKKLDARRDELRAQGADVKPATADMNTTGRLRKDAVTPVAAPAGPGDRDRFAALAATALGTSKDNVLAQLKLETSGDGSKTIGKFNYGNIKAGSQWKGATVPKNVAEMGPNGAYTEHARFRSYDSLEDAAKDYAATVKKIAPKAAGAKSAREYGQALQDAGYATDPHYASKIAHIAKSRIEDKKAQLPAHFSDAAFDAAMPKEQQAAATTEGKAAAVEHTFNHRITLVDQHQRPRFAPVVTTQVHKPQAAGARL